MRLWDALIAPFAPDGPGLKPRDSDAAAAGRLRGRAAGGSVRREHAVAMVARLRGATSHIRVWAPCPPSKRKLKAWRDAGAKPEDRPRTYFRFEAVFSQEQVEALPPPAEPAPLGPPIVEVQGSSLAWAREPVEALAAELGYSVTYCTLPTGRGGSCDSTTKVLTINDDASVNAQVDVACHELAHALVRVDRQDDDPELDYAAEELVAESVVFCPALA